MNNQIVMEHLLKINHLAGYFEVVLAAEGVKCSKPELEIFKKKKLQIYRCLWRGDGF
jgi:FMN phosphatase YigB (HAD superfamily)